VRYTRVMDLRGIPGLFRPRPVDAGPIASMVASAMAEDPLERYFFPSPKAGEAAEVLFRLIAGYGIRQDCLLAASPRLEGVAYWELPEGRGPRCPPEARRSGRQGWYSGVPTALAEGLHLLGRAGPGGVLRMLHYSSFSLGLRRRHAPFAHGYLALLAVDPRCQGLGFGGALLRPVLARLEESGLPCYLETHTPRNVSFYGHFGFDVVEQAEIPGTGVRQWCLLKKSDGRRPGLAT